MSPIRVCDIDHLPEPSIEALSILEAGEDDPIKSIDLCKVCRDAFLSGDWATLAARKVEVVTPAPRRGRPPGTRQPRTPRVPTDQQKADEAALAEQLQRTWREAVENPDQGEEVA